MSDHNNIFKKINNNCITGRQVKDGLETRKVIVQLTEDNLVIKEQSPPQHLGSTAINSTSSTSEVKPTLSRQTTASLSSQESQKVFNEKIEAVVTQDSTTPKQNHRMPAEEPLERVVTIKRQQGGGLGISVKGGAEHGIPVLISRVFPGQAADQTHLLHPGDAIMAVNDTRVEHMMHDDVVAQLRSCGHEVALTVCTFEDAGHVLRPPVSSANSNKSPVSSDQPQTTTTSTPTKIKDGEESTKAVGNDLNVSTQIGHVPNSPAPALLAADSTRKAINVDENRKIITVENVPQDSVNGEKSQKMEINIPLLLARLERYHSNTDQLRENEFEVFGSNNISSGSIICSSPEQLNDWTNAIAKAISNSIKKHINLFNQSHADVDHVYAMGWVSERKQIMTGTPPDWSHCFIAARGELLYIFEQPPNDEEDWKKCLRVFTLYESLCRTHAHHRHLLDKRLHCFSVQHGNHSPIYCSLQTKEDLSYIESQIQKATHESVYRLQTKTYQCTKDDGTVCDFIINFNQGFKLVDSTTKVVLWGYKFSQLKGSSDDGNTKVTFTFHNRANDVTDIQSFHCHRAYHLLFCVHAFLAAKLSLVDPSFIGIPKSPSTSTTYASPVLSNGVVH